MKLYTDVTILYLENHKYSTHRKIFKLINKFSKVVGYKINIQKSIAFLYTNNEILGKEFKNAVTFKIAPPKIKYLEINLTKEVTDLMPRPIKHYSRKLKRIQRNGKIPYAPRLEVLMLLKWPYYPKQPTDSMPSLSNYP